MSALDILRFAGGALLGHRLRSSLSLLGMSIGVGAVVLLTALGEGARRYVVDQFSSIGSNILIVVPGRNETTGVYPGVGGVPNDLTLRDAEALLRGVPEVVDAAPIVTGTESVAHGELGRDAVVFGTTRSIERVLEFEMAAGEFLPETEWDRGSAIAVVGADVARDLFRGENPLGGVLRIGDRRARVIGLLGARGTQLGVNFDDAVIIPVATAMQLFNRSSLFRVMLRVSAHADMERARERVTQLLIERHDGEEDFTCLTQDAVVSTLSTILGALTAALVAIAAVSLGVAGIVIMNVMLVSVAERRGEIGLLKALGAGRRQILVAFLTEAALLSLAGATIGLAVGFGGARFLEALYPAFPAAPPWWAVVAALLVALVAGIAFGVLPARNATRLDPVEALAKR